MNIETIALADVADDPSNARRHSTWNLKSVRRSLERFGQQKPVVIDAAGTLIAGHATVAAARALGWETIDAVRSDLDGTARTAYAIADNRTAELGEWDERLLAEALKDLRTEDLIVGFGDKNVDRYLKKLAEPIVEDEAPDAPDTPVTRAGDLWLMGEHRLLCGDATCDESVARLLKETPFIMVTDPPYGVQLDQGWFEKMGLDPARRCDYVHDDRVHRWPDVWKTCAADVAYVWCASVSIDDVMTDLRAAGFNIRALCIWVKDRPVVTREGYLWQHEPCIYAVRKGKKARWRGGNNESTVWRAASPTRRFDSGEDTVTDHAAQKPVEIMARSIRNHGETGDVVYEPFAGSGTTLIAAEQLERRCFAMEIEPRFVDMICARYLKFTGCSPVRESDGASFQELQTVKH